MDRLSSYSKLKNKLTRIQRTLASPLARVVTSLTVDVRVIMGFTITVAEDISISTLSICQSHFDITSCHSGKSCAILANLFFYPILSTLPHFRQE
ncbi:hypothetical protein J4G07_11920 [Candidatus Poribacteria bacterium]|nr:hypothetical protein [Candidatus Poribacteria bacterium]